MLAIMSITSSNSQESETVKAKLGFKGFGAAVDASFSQNLSKISESSQVDFQMFVRGPSLDALPAVTAHDIPALIAFAKTWPGLVKTKGGSSWLTNVTLESYSNVSFDGEKFELGNKINQSVLKNLTLNRDSRQNILNQINEYRQNPQRFELNKDPNFEKNMLAFEASLFDQIEKINGLARNCINSGICSLFTLQMPYGEIPSLKQYDWEKICASERKTAYRNDLIDRFTYLELQAANLVPDYTDRTRTEIKGFLNCKDSQPSYFKLKLY